MPASNIKTVKLLSNGQVTIIGEFKDIDKYDVKLLHVWLAQPGGPGENGVGLAIDCLAENGSCELKGNTFTLTDTGANDAPFIAGPATVSAIAVLTPKDSSGRLPAEAIQWSRTLTLSEDGKHVGLTTF